MKNGDAYSRAYGVLQADKAPASEGCQALVVQDLKEKFSQYFDLVGEPTMRLETKKGKLLVTLSFEAERMKKFNVLK